MSILLGMYIGEGKANYVIHFYKISLQMAIAEFIRVCVRNLSQVWLVYNICVIFDTTEGIAMSAITAAGQKKIGTVITGFAYLFFRNLSEAGNGFQLRHLNYWHLDRANRCYRLHHCCVRVFVLKDGFRANY